MRVFVIWDLASPAVQTLLEALPELLPEHGGEQIDWQIPSATATGRQLARDVIAAGIRGADHVIALLDRPSSSVGWQVGLALGWGKSLQLSFIGRDLPTWTQVGALKGLFAHHLSDVSGVRQLLEKQPWDMPGIPPAKAPESLGTQLVLCPTGPIGSTLREVALQAQGGSAALPDDGWGLYELPLLLGGQRRVVWVLASDVREGADNASNGVVAGFAEASGLSVAVLRAEDLPPVIDVQPRELRFRGIGEFKGRLGQLSAGSGLQLRSQPSATSGRTQAVGAEALPAVTEPKRRRWLGPLLGFTLLAGAGLGISQLVRHPKSAAPPPQPAAVSAPAPAKEAQPPAPPPAAAAATPTEKDKHRPSRSGHGGRTGQPFGPNEAMAMMMNMSRVGMMADPNTMQQQQQPEQEQPQPKPAPRPTNCKVSDERIGQLATDIQAERFEFTQREMAEAAGKKYCLSVAQLEWLLQSFQRAEAKLSVIRAAAPRVRDPENAEQLLVNFPAGYERSQVMSQFQR